MPTEEAKPKATAKAEKPAKVVAPKIEKNGITRPRSDTSQTGKVWEIADKLANKLKRPPTRKEVLSEAGAAGINPATCATQYGRWRKFYAIPGTAAEPKAAA